MTDDELRIIALRCLATMPADDGEAVEHIVAALKKVMRT